MTWDQNTDTRLMSVHAPKLGHFGSGRFLLIWIIMAGRLATKWTNMLVRCGLSFLFYTIIIHISKMLTLAETKLLTSLQGGHVKYIFNALSQEYANVTQHIVQYCCCTVLNMHKLINTFTEMTHLLNVSNWSSHMQCILWITESGQKWQVSLHNLRPY